MRFRIASFAALTLLLAGAGVLLAGDPARAQICTESRCQPTTTTTTRPTTTTSTSTPGTTSTTTPGTTTSTTSPGGTTSTTAPGIGSTSTSTTAGGGPVGRPVEGPTTTSTSFPPTGPGPMPRAPTGGLPVTGGDILALVVIGLAATSVGAGLLRRD